MVISIIGNLFFLMLYFVLMRLLKKASTPQPDGEYFVVKFPLILCWAAHISALGGGCFCIIFLFRYLKDASQITIGHFWIAGAFIIIGIVLQIVYMRWSIIVYENRMTFNRIIKPTVQYDIKDIDEVSMFEAMLKITVDGKLITYVDHDTDNFDALCTKFVEFGVIKE